MPSVSRAHQMRTEPPRPISQNDESSKHYVFMRISLTRVFPHTYYLIHFSLPANDGVPNCALADLLVIFVRMQLCSIKVEMSPQSFQNQACSHVCNSKIGYNFMKKSVSCITVHTVKMMQWRKQYCFWCKPSIMRLSELCFYSLPEVLSLYKLL